MKRTQFVSRAAAAAALTSLVIATGAGSVPAARTVRQRAGDCPCATPEEALQRYVCAVNAGDFSAQYALFAAVEHEGFKPAPIPLLPRSALQQLLSSRRPAFPHGLRLSARPVRTLTNFGARQSRVVAGFLVPVLAPGQPAPPSGPYSDTYLVAVQPSPDGWKVRAWATYWMYFQRACGTKAGRAFRDAYRKETARLGLIPTAKSVRS